MLEGTRPLDPWAADIDDEDHGLESGQTRADAIAAAMEPHIEDVDCGWRDTGTITLTVYHGPTGCDMLGEDCECGGMHEDYDWILMGWHRREVVTVRVWRDGLYDDGDALWEVVDGE